MKVTVRLFSLLRRYAPDPEKAEEPFEVTLPEGSTLADLFASLEIPEREIRVAFVDDHARAGVFRLTPGTEVGIFPPIGGG